MTYNDFLNQCKDHFGDDLFITDYACEIMGKEFPTDPHYDIFERNVYICRNRYSTTMVKYKVKACDGSILCHDGIISLGD